MGYPDGTVRPEKNIKRAEVAVVFYRMLTSDKREEYWTLENPYSDVAPDSWYNAAVSVLSNMDVIKGYLDGTFRPEDDISRAELAAIAARFAQKMHMIGLTSVTFNDISEHWASNDIDLAAQIGWVTGYPDGSFKPDRTIKRAEFITLVNNVLQRKPETVDDLLVEEMKTWPDNADSNEWYYLAIQEATNSHAFNFKAYQMVPGKQFEYEYWTKMTPFPDWTQLERQWIAEYGG